MMFGKKKEPRAYEPYYQGKRIVALNLNNDGSYTHLDNLIDEGWKVISGASVTSGYYGTPAYVIILQKPTQDKEKITE